MRLLYLCTTGQTAFLLCLVIIAELCVSLFHIKAYGFQEKNGDLLAEWYPASLQSHQLLIKNRIRVYQNKRSSNDEAVPGQDDFPVSNMTVWPGDNAPGAGGTVAMSYGGLFPKDPFNKRRPPFMPGLFNNDFTLTVLPVLRLADDWQQYFSGSHWWHWIAGEPDYDSGVTVLFSVDGHSPVAVQVAPEEYQYLADPRALLSWLAARINGRDALVQSLLTLMESMSAVIDERVVDSLKHQLADLLDTPGILLDVTLEWFWLQTTLEGLLVEFPENKGQPNALSLTSQGNSAAAGSTGNHQIAGDNNKNPSPGNNRQDNGQIPDPSMPSPKPAEEPVEGPYFTLIAEGKEYRLARNQLDPARRGQEEASGIYVYRPESLATTWPLTELEQQAGVQPVLRLPDTDQKALNYLTSYGNKETIEALRDFYPVDVLQITEDSQLQHSSGLTDEQLHGNCIICQDPMQHYRGAVRTDCAHVFHLPCLITYFAKQVPDDTGQLKLTCPICRRKQSRLGQLLASQEALSQELLHASGHSLEVVVRVLLEAQVSSAAADPQGQTALHLAARANNLGIVVLLLSGGANVQQENHQGLTAIDLASMAGHRPIVETLSETIGVSPVFYWAAYGFTDEIQTRINLGEELVSLRNHDGSTLLHMASARGHKDIAEKLLNYAQSLHMDIIDCQDNQQQTPLCAACDNGEVTMARFLIARGATIEPVAPESKGPLYFAARKGCLDIVLLLSEQSGNHENEELTSALVIAACHGRHKVVSFLLQQGIDLTSAWLNQALLEAAQQGHWQVLSVLFNSGTHWEAVAKNQALMTAVGNNQVNAARILMEHNALSTGDKNFAFSLLVQAVISNQPKMVRLLLTHGAPVNRARKGDGATALILAADHGWLEVAKVLIEHDADVNQSSAWYFGAKTYTPLQLAVMHGRNEMVKILLENVAIVSGRIALPQVARKNFALFDAVGKRNIRKVTQLLKEPDSLNTGNALYYAALGGLVQTTTVLLRQGANPNYIRLTEGNTPLHGAVKGEHIKLIRLLLDNGADPETENDHGLKPIDVASQNGNMDVVALLSARMQKAQVQTTELKSVLSMDAGHALYHGAANGHYDIVKWLLDNKADPNLAEESEGDTPLHAAARNNHADIIRLLLDKGANPDIANNNDQTALDLARQSYQKAAAAELQRASLGRGLLIAIEQNNQKLIRELLEGGADPVYRNKQGDTALHLAASKGQAELVSLLLEYTSQHSPTNGQYTPLHLAVIHGFAEVAEILLNAGANPAVLTSGPDQQVESSLELAVRHNQPAMVAVLAKHPQVDINGFTGEQYTALHIAAQAGWSDMVSLLLSLGAEPRLRNQNGDTLFHIVCRVFSQEQLQNFIAGQNDHLQYLSDESLLNHSNETPLAILSCRDDLGSGFRDKITRQVKEEPPILPVSDVP